MESAATAATGRVAVIRHMGGHDAWWQQGVGSLSSMAPAKTDGNKCGALTEGDLTTPSTSTFQVPIADLMRPPTKRQQRRIVDNKDQNHAKLEVW